MKVTVFTGDIAEAPAEVICTSTNPRLSLMMGTGGAVRERGGFSVLRECEAIVAASPSPLRPGSVHVTSAGALPYKAVIHCVASGESHHSSPAIVRACAANALAAAAERGFARVAMPVFATGHAHVRYREALAAMAEALRSAPPGIDEVIVVVDEADRAEEARRAISPPP